MKIVITGDSITANTGVSSIDKGYAYKVINGLGFTLGVDAVNTAATGCTSQGLLTNIVPMITSHQPQHCVIMIGTNDILMDAYFSKSPLEGSLSYINRISNIYTILNSSNIRITFISSIPSLKPGEQVRSMMYARALQDFCTQVGANFIDLNAGFIYYLNQRSSEEFNSWYYDDYHPNDIGHNIMAYYILKTQIKVI